MGRALKSPGVFTRYQCINGIDAQFHCPVELAATPEIIPPPKTPYRLPKYVKPDIAAPIIPDLRHMYSLFDTHRSQLRTHPVTPKLSYAHPNKPIIPEKKPTFSSKPLRDELAVTYSNYLMAYNQRYHNIKVVSSDCPIVVARAARRKWNRIMTFLRDAIKKDTGSFCRYRPKSRTWFILYRNMPFCPLVRLNKVKALAYMSRCGVREDRLEAMLGSYMRFAGKQHQKLSCIPRGGLPDINEVFELVPMRANADLNRSRHDMMMRLLESSECRNNMEMTCRKYEKTVDSAVDFWRTEAKLNLRNTNKRLTKIEREFYRDVLTEMSGLQHFPTICKDIGIQTSMSLGSLFPVTLISIWRGFFEYKAINKYRPEDDREVRFVKFKWFPLPEITLPSASSIMFNSFIKT